MVNSKTSVSKDSHTSNRRIPIARTVPISRVRSRIVMRSVLTTPIRMIKNRISTMINATIPSTHSIVNTILAASYIVVTSNVAPFQSVFRRSLSFFWKDFESGLRSNNFHSLIKVEKSGWSDSSITGSFGSIGKKVSYMASGWTNSISAVTFVLAVKIAPMW